MKGKILLAILLVGTAIMLMQSCEVNGCSKGDMSSNSRSGEDGEKMKGNCMTCHGPNGSGRGCFTVGGTVYDSSQQLTNSNAVIMLYTQPNGGGQLVATLDVDGSGNFYTTSVINFGSGLYASVASKNSNKVQYMPNPTVSGNCNSCHGISNAKIWIN